jgi:glycosyltransferase involved in cell wall biosynthesis
MKTITLSANTSWYLYNFRASTIRRLLQDGYRVVCLSPDDGYGQKIEQEFGCQWQELAMDNLGSNPLKDIALVLRFWQFYRRLKPFVAFHFTIKNNVYGTWAARSLGIPSINNVSGLGTAFIRSGLVAKLVRLLYKASMPLAARVFCQNQEDYHLLIEQKLVPADRLQLLPGSGVNLQRFNPQLRQSHAGAFRFLYAGRMLADKGLRELIKAMQNLNQTAIQCELWLCGFADVQNVSAITLEELKAWGRLPGVKWMGPTDNMVAVYAQVDAAVLPSYREGLPRGLLEAGAMGLPSVTTDVPGCRNIIEDGFNGIICEVKNSLALQQAMQKLLDMPAGDRQRLADNARQYVQENFDEGLVVEAAMQVISGLVEGT